MMIKKVFKFQLDPDKKRLLENFLSLSVLQGANYILPLITLPYLVRVLGVEKFGLVMFSQSFVIFFNIFVDFGFNLFAVREISIYRDNKRKLTEIFSSIILIKLILILISLFTLSIIIFTFDRFKNDKILYYSAFLMVIGQALIPIWYFQGLEKMKYITIVNVFSKLLFAIAIFIFVHHQNDYLLVPLLNGLGFIVGGILSLYLLYVKFHQKFEWQNVNKLLYYFKKSSHFFLSRVANEGSHNYLTFILGIAFDSTIVGYYTMVERLYKAFYLGVQPLIQVIYPYMAKEKNVVFFKKIYVLITVPFAIISIILIVNANLILNIIYGISNDVTYKLFLILFLSSVIGVTNALIGYPLLGALGLTKEVNYSLVFGAIVAVTYVTICFLLKLNVFYYVFSVFLYELISTFYRLYYVKDIMFKEDSLCKH